MEFFTGQRRTIDLSVGSLCPPLIRHNMHLSSAVHQTRVSRKSSEFRIVLSSSCCPVLQFQFLLPSTVTVNCGQQCSHASIKIANGCVMRWDGCIQNNWLASKHISLLQFSPNQQFPLLIVLHLLFSFTFAFYISDIGGNTELEVIPTNPHKLNCFYPSMHIFTADDLYPLEVFYPVVSSYCNSRQDDRLHVFLWFCAARLLLMHL